MSQEAVVLIFRKILIPFSILFSVYRMYRNKRADLNIIFSLVIMLFLIFSGTYSYREHFHYDVIDKFLILAIYPICFLGSSLLFLINRDKGDKEEAYRYIGVLVFFVVVEILYIVDIF